MNDETCDVRLVLPDDFDDRMEFEIAQRGYLSHSFVEDPVGNRFPVFFIDPIRLQQDLAESTSRGEPWFAEPGLIVLPEVTLDGVRACVDSLWRDGFFCGSPKSTGTDKESADKESAE